MKAKKLLVSIVLLVGALGFQPVVAQTDYVADLNESSIVWHGKKVAGEHTGSINLAKGELKMEGDVIKGGHFEVDMPSITNTDLDNPSYKKKLEDHLKSDDFFSVEKYPVARFVITKGEKQNGDSYRIMGNLTIKNITHPIEFMAKLYKHDEELHVQAKIVVDRSKFDVRYGSGSFFTNLGDKMIYDNFELVVNMSMIGQ